MAARYRGCAHVWKNAYSIAIVCHCVVPEIIRTPQLEGLGNSEGWVGGRGGGLKGIFFWEVRGQQSNRIFQGVDPSNWCNELQRAAVLTLQCFRLFGSTNIAFANHTNLSFLKNESAYWAVKRVKQDRSEVNMFTVTLCNNVALCNTSVTLWNNTCRTL